MRNSATDWEESMNALGLCKTTLEAIEELLEQKLYEAVPLIATIPDLLAGLK